jgi:hypothetical protein
MTALLDLTAESLEQADFGAALELPP